MIIARKKGRSRTPQFQSSIVLLPSYFQHTINHRFQPQTRDGEAVPALAIITIAFNLEG
jgi:hypothetical protein